MIALLIMGCTMVDNPTTTVGPGVDAPRLSEIDPTDPAFQAALRDVSPFQRELMADGEVSHDELQRAYYATISCMEAKGFHVLATDIDVEGNYDWSFGSPKPGGFETEEDLEESGSAEAYDECESEYFLQVFGFYQITHPVELPPDPYDAITSAEVAECMTELGFPVTQPVPVGTAEWHLRLETMPAGSGLAFRQCESKILSPGS